MSIFLGNSPFFNGANLGSYISGGIGGLGYSASPELLRSIAQNDPYIGSRVQSGLTGLGIANPTAAVPQQAQPNVIDRGIPGNPLAPSGGPGFNPGSGYYNQLAGWLAGGGMGEQPQGQQRTINPRYKDFLGM